MSYPLHKHRIQSMQPVWLTAVGGLLLGALAGCAGTPEQPKVAERAPADPVVETASAKTTKNDTIDQSPIVIEPATDNSSAQQEDRLNTAKKDTDMTVLVMDDPELIAKSAALEAGIVMPLNTMEDSPRRPHRMKFHYGFDKHRLSEEDQQILRTHAAYLQAHPEVTVEIHGHTDSFGAEEYNAFLSRLRAGAAAKLLKSEGVRDSQIRVIGWGSTKPLTNREDHAANRRLELEYHSGQMAKAQ